MFKKRFTKEERKELREIVTKEGKEIMKRPMYLMGFNIMLGLMVYFSWRGHGANQLKWPTVNDAIWSAIAILTVGLVFWLIGIIKKTGWPIFFMLFWIFIIFICTLQMFDSLQGEYYVYAILVGLGWLCNEAAIKKHFVEKIYQQEKNGKE